MLPKISVVVPARNESATVAGVVAAMKQHSAVAEVIVVDSASSDDTGARALAEGARVIRLEQPGFGRAVKAGFAAAQQNWIFKLDGDMRNVSADWLSAHLNALQPGVGLVKAYWENSEDPMPVTNLVVKPAIRLVLQELSHINMPISGIYLCDKTLLKGQNLADDYTHDLDILVRIHRLGSGVEQIHLGEVLDCLKPVNNYFGMANDLLKKIHEHAEVSKSAPLMLVLAHPDDAEIWCGGTIAKMLLSGGVVHLWLIAAAQERRQEALRLSEIFGNLRVMFLDGDEFSPRIDKNTINTIKNSISLIKPKTLITHHHADIHPDHRACFELVSAACLAVERESLPRSIYVCNSYFNSSSNISPFQPDTFIDISTVADLKYEFIDHHQSQDVSHWCRMAVAMDNLNGAKCGVGKAEAFQKVSFYTSPHSIEFP